ncbi:hypothetical protein D3C86_2063330 [compost metagenome]
MDGGAEGAGGQFEQVVGRSFRFRGECCKADDGEQHGDQAHGYQEHVDLFILVGHQASPGTFLLFNFTSGAGTPEERAALQQVDVSPFSQP